MWLSINCLIQTKVGQSPQRIFCLIFKTSQIVKSKGMCLFIGGNWLSNQLSNVEIKLCYMLFKSLTTAVCPTYLVINLAGTVERCHACINFSGPPHTHLSTGLHQKNKECGQFFQSGLIKGEEHEECVLCLQRAVATKCITKINTPLNKQQPCHCLQRTIYSLFMEN